MPADSGMYVIVEHFVVYKLPSNGPLHSMNSVRAASGCQEARDWPGRSRVWELRVGDCTPHLYAISGITDEGLPAL